eukprot:767548-Hanusia_phi.AAC.6
MGVAHADPRQGSAAQRVRCLVTVPARTLLVPSLAEEVKTCCSPADLNLSAAAVEILPPPSPVIPSRPPILRYPLSGSSLVLKQGGYKKTFSDSRFLLLTCSLACIMSAPHLLISQFFSDPFVRFCTTGQVVMNRFFPSRTQSCDCRLSLAQRCDALDGCVAVAARVWRRKKAQRKVRPNNMLAYSCACLRNVVV